MSEQTVIDSLEFARTGEQLGGTLAIATLERLKESLSDAAGEIRFEVRGGRDGRGRPALILRVDGVLRLQCQRCLGALDFPLRLVNTLLLGSADEDVPGDDDAEWIEASPALDVAGLVEDEVLLSLPYAPRHEPGSCAPLTGASTGEAETAAFAKLAELKRRTH